ncbi:beta strand repeat-containing protein, partial [Flavobacterium sp.]|uniref:beta strand repeat-containing protein n=1 Tax=Flavobacterium sp. TaxID=239 RepID=UPI003BEA2FD0
MKQIYLTKKINEIVSTILILLGLKKESIGLSTTSTSKPLINFDSRNSFGLYSFKAALVFLFFMSIGANAQINYYSKASATSFTNTSSWGTSLDGSGAAPTSISSASNFIVANGAALTLDANASVRFLSITSGSLTVSANTLTVGLSSGNAANLTITNGGYLTVNTGGTINVNGFFLQSSGGVFTQNGGNINVDGNSGAVGITMSGASSSGKTITVASTAGLLVNSVVTVSSGTGVLPANTFVTSILSATQFTINNTPTTALATATLFATNSVTSANSLVSIAGSPSTLFLNGGTFTIVDPHANSGSVYALSVNANPAINASINHTFKFGNGISADAGLSTNGFYIYLFPGSSSMILGNVLVDNNVNLTNNRQVTTFSNIGILGNLTVNPGGEYRVSSTTYLAGNLINNGTVTSTGTLNFGSYFNAVIQPASASQTISGSGFFRNSVTVPTANFTNLTFNNTSTNGVVFNGANTLMTPGNIGTVSGTVTFTNCPGGVDLGGGTFTQGINAATPGTTSWTAGGFKNGTFKKWFGTATLPTALPSTSAGNFPFVVNGANRNFQIGSSIATLTSGGTISVTYTSTSGLATVTGTDPSGTFSYDRLSNAYWAVSSGDGLATTGTFLVNGGMEGITNLTAITNE